MFRLTILLLAGLGLAMYFADSFPGAAEKPAVVAVQEAAPTAESTSRDEPQIKTEVATVVETPTVTPEPETPVVTEAVVGESITPPSYLDLFQSPAVVDSDGTLQIAVAETPDIDVNIALQEALETQQDAPINVQFVTGERVNVRQAPTTSAAVVDQVVFAEAVEVLTDPENGWVMIRIEGDGVQGFMASRFLQTSDPQG